MMERYNFRWRSVWLYLSIFSVSYCCCIHESTAFLLNKHNFNPKPQICSSDQNKVLSARRLIHPESRNDNDCDDEDNSILARSNQREMSRRWVIQKSLLIACGSCSSISSAVLWNHQEVHAAMIPTLEDCLLDLPPCPENYVRIYLCRHGQTENNRLHLVQGARINPPINEVGQQMAVRIGQALSAYADQQQQQQQFVSVHSSLLRAQQTAEYASYSYHQSHQPTETQSIEDKNILGYPILGVLPELNEVDFGSVVEGKPASEVRTKMLSTFAAWSIGNIDTVNGGDGESARQVSTGTVPLIYIDKNYHYFYTLIEYTQIFNTLTIFYLFILFYDGQNIYTYRF